MTVKIGINGLGRIGRCVLRASLEGANKDVEIVAINSRGPVEQHVHLLKYDSVHGKFAGEVSGKEAEYLEVDGKRITLSRERDPKDIKWADMGVDVVLDCTGVFKDHEKASWHLEGGAKKVLISAPSKDPDATIVYGVNNEVYSDDKNIISVGSCTTNCLAPVAKVLNDEIGIEKGYMTTIHAYTNDQNTVDAGHDDLRRARAAALSMIPTSTGAAKALGLVLPELKGKLDGTSIRVPTPNVSLVDLCFQAKRTTSVDEIHEAIREAAGGTMYGVLGVCERPLVSIDFTHDPHSAVFDMTQTQVVDGDFVRVAAWYDNEWGFSCRMLDVAALVG